MHLVSIKKTALHPVYQPTVVLDGFLVTYKSHHALLILFCHMTQQDINKSPFS